MSEQTNNGGAPCDPSTQTPQYCIRGGGFLRPGEPQPPLPSGAPDVDYSAFNDSQVMKPVEQVKAGLQQIVDEARQYEAEILAAEKALKDAKAKYRGIVEDVLPKALREAGYGDVGFPTTDGTIVKVRSKLENSVPAARRNEAWDWLEKHNLADIIKREVKIAFNVTEKDLADAVAKSLSEEHGRTVSCDRWVEPSTLKSTLVQLLEKQTKEEGAIVVPRDLFGIREMDVAEFKAPKEKK